MGEQKTGRNEPMTTSEKEKKSSWAKNKRLPGHLVGGGDGDLCHRRFDGDKV